MIKACIFDVDGVLLDTVPYHFEAWKKMFHEAGTEIDFNDYLKKINGLPRITGITNMLPTLNAKDCEKLAEHKQTLFLEAVKINPPQPLTGVVSFLKMLKKMKYIIAAASSSKNAPFLLKQSGLASYLEIIISGSDFTHSKPNPEIFLKAAEKLKLEPEVCIVIEDAYLGALAAKNAGMKSIGLLSSGDKEITSTADSTIQSMSEYKKALEYIYSVK